MYLPNNMPKNIVIIEKILINLAFYALIRTFVPTKRNMMNETKYFKVAEVLFSVTAGTCDFDLMTNYEPFAFADGLSLPSAFQLVIKAGDAVDYREEMRQDDEGQEIICGKTADGNHVFEFIWANETAGWLLCGLDYKQASLIVTGRYRKLAIDNALMILFALSTAGHGVALFHASTVSFAGKAYMFLGVSGTGKSTHSSLWLKHIEGTELLNDDNPVVRVSDDDRVTVYGSPWSGKTPCYRNLSYPLGGIVLLSQAPYNKIHRLKGIQAYVALVPSISGKRWEARIADGLHQTENKLAMSVPVWHLECLPDEAAAQLCHQTIAV